MKRTPIRAMAYAFVYNGIVDQLLGTVLLISLVVGILLGLTQLADWLKRRREAPTTAITNGDPQPQIVNMRGCAFNINVSGGHETAIEPVPARTANDHAVPESEGEDSLIGGICPFEAPSRPEL